MNKNGQDGIVKTMIKVALVSTQPPERCGLADYIAALMYHTEDQDIEYTVLSRPFDGSLISRLDGFDIMHVHHVWSLFGGLQADHIKTIKAKGIKTICMFNESTTDNRSDFTMSFDRVIVHQETTDGFTHIPHPIWNLDLPEYRGTYSKFIGTAGFPIGFKNDHLVAEVAARFGLSVMAFIPEAQYGDANGSKQKILSYCPNAIVNTNFVPSPEIIKSLSECLFTLFPHQHAGGGISGSVRFGLSARRPCIVTKTSRTADLYKDYQDEVYFIHSADPTINDLIPVVTQVLDDLHLNQEKIPNKVVEDMDWKKMAAKYVQVYKELMQ